MTGLGPNKDQAPTDWISTFGGPSWSPSGMDDGQWYFHTFDSSQPDFDWLNEDVKEDFIKTLRFWGDRGVSGFRVDVAQGITKDMTEPLPCWETLLEMSHAKLQRGNGHLKHPILDRDETQDIFRSWRKVFNEYEPPLM
jgi:alpha-glucosidase